MNFARTALLLAAMTALFLAVGYLIAAKAGDGRVPDRARHERLGVLELGQDGAAHAQCASRDARSAPELVGLVEQLARRAGLPMPKVYLLETDQPNAFATGRNPEHTAVAVTRGLLEACEREELAGVIAHELGHIKNRDTLTMTITATLAGAIGFLAQFAFFFGGGETTAIRWARSARSWS